MFHCFGSQEETTGERIDVRVWIPTCQRLPSLWQVFCKNEKRMNVQALLKRQRNTLGCKESDSFPEGLKNIFNPSTEPKCDKMARTRALKPIYHIENWTGIIWNSLQWSLSKPAALGRKTCKAWKWLGTVAILAWLSTLCLYEKHDRWITTFDSQNLWNKRLWKRSAQHRVESCWCPSIAHVYLMRFVKEPSNSCHVFKAGRCQAPSKSMYSSIPCTSTLRVYVQGQFVIKKWKQWCFKTNNTWGLTFFWRRVSIRRDFADPFQWREIRWRV